MSIVMSKIRFPYIVFDSRKSRGKEKKMFNMLQIKDLFM